MLEKIWMIDVESVTYVWLLLDHNKLHLQKVLKSSFQSDDFFFINLLKDASKENHIISRKDCADLAEKEDIAMNDKDFGKALELFDELNLVLYLYRVCEASRGAAHAALVEGGDQDTCSLNLHKKIRCHAMQEAEHKIAL